MASNLTDTKAADPPADELTVKHGDGLQSLRAMVRARLFAPKPAADRIGRYVILDEIGRGAMGMVYAAYDEKLDRKVAVKLMLTDELFDGESRQRFTREAQALARLSHPNVVTVHEVGEHDGELFLAMEFVRGQSIGDWLRTKPGWEQVLEAFLQAGRGLAAAHRAHLIHRDFKPHNMMRTEDGVVKVLDFGLARTIGTEADGSVDVEVSGGGPVELSGSGADTGLDSSTTRSPAASPFPRSALTSSLTVLGAVMGTPVYMSPEQMQGHAVDARSDQFSFCVALYEGLYGKRPYIETCFEDRLRSVLSREVHPVPRGSKVPSKVRRALQRGLEPDPAARWPTMDALLNALQPEPGSGRNRWWLGLTGLTALVAVGTAATKGSEASTRPCQGAREQLAGIWDQARQAEVEAAIASVGLPYARNVEAKTRRDLSTYADDWVAMHTHACEATAVRGEQSPQVLDLRMRCLHRAAEDLRATVDTLADADDEVVRRAHTLVAGLRPLSRCEDIEALAADVEPPLPEEAEAVELARQHLARARNQHKAGRYGAARETIEAAAAALEGVAYEPVRAELLLDRGHVLVSLGEYEASQQVLSEALELATRSGQSALGASIAIGLMDVVGYQRDRANEALMLQPVVLGLTEHDPRLRAEYRAILGVVLVAQGKYAEAEAELRAVLELHQRTLAPDHPAVIDAHRNLCIVLIEQGESEEAERECRLAIEHQQRALGPDHPAIADLRSNLASALTRAGKLEQAVQEHRASLALVIKALGPDHPDVAASHNNLGVALKMQGKLEDAARHLRTARTMWEGSLGPESVDVIMARSNLANVLAMQGRLDEAEAELRAVLALRLGTRTPDHPDVANDHWNLALVLERRGRYEEARAEIMAALASYEKAVGPRHPWIADSREKLAILDFSQGKHAEAEAEGRAALALRLEVMDPDDPAIAMSKGMLAETLRASGRLSDALILAEQAWDRHQRDDVLPENRGYCAYVLATILHEIKGPARDRARARELVEASLRAYQAAGGGHEADVRDAQRWLDEHPAPR